MMESFHKKLKPKNNTSVNEFNVLHNMDSMKKRSNAVGGVGAHTRKRVESMD